LTSGGDAAAAGGRWPEPRRSRWPWLPPVVRPRGPGGRTVTPSGAARNGRPRTASWLAVDGGEQGGVRADQGGVLLRKRGAVRLAALRDPLVGQVHGPGPVRRRGPDHVLRLAVEIAVQPRQRPDQLVVVWPRRL